MQYVSPDDTVKGLIEAIAQKYGDHVFCRFEGSDLSYRQLDARVNALANGLLRLGVGPGDRVAVMLPHHPDHILTFFALAKLGAILVPINVHLKGASLEYLLQHSDPRAIIADRMYETQIVPAIDVVGQAGVRPDFLIWRGGVGATVGDLPQHGFSHLANSGNAAPPATTPSPNDVLAICYTSGTTGAPKGALITDKMYRAAAVGSLMVSGIADNDVLLFWEPIYHLFGIEVLVLAVMKPVTLGMVERFSATQFWSQARHCGATHIHYVGGVPQLLMKQPEGPIDRHHCVRVAWGGGCPINIWRSFERRFGIHMRDSFGMTETASLNIINIEGEPGALGRPLPHFEVRLVNEEGEDVGPGVVAELLIRGREPGLTTPGYYKDLEATAKTIRNGWLHTGDLVRRDERGIYFFVGRKKDSIRRRGENVSAWEVERVLNSHPDVEESALIPVANEFGDEEIKAFIKPRDKIFDVRALARWCEERMAKYQIPRFIALVEEFPKTPTQRIKKHELSRSILDCWDREKNDLHNSG